MTFVLSTRVQVRTALPAVLILAEATAVGKNRRTVGKVSRCATARECRDSARYNGLIRYVLTRRRILKKGEPDEWRRLLFSIESCVAAVSLDSSVRVFVRFDLDRFADFGRPGRGSADPSGNV
jgi:hypothetical protein